MSNAEKKIVSAICMTQGIALRISAAYKDRTGCKDIKRRLADLDEVCSHAFDLYFGRIDPKTAQRITQDFLRIDKACLRPDNGETMDTAVLTSLSLGMLSDVLDKVRQPKNHEAITWVHDRALRVHRYFDSRGKRWADYARATAALDTWHQMTGV